MGQGGGGGRNRKGKRNESAYESRYFIAFGSAKKESRSVELSNVTSYTEAEAMEMADQVYAGTADSGFIEECYYRRYVAGGRTNILFLNCETRLSAVRQLIRISLIVCCAGILAAWLLMSLFSTRAIQPILENSARQKQFITDASHELKTPLSVISANMDVMAMDDPDNEWIRSTRRQTGLMTRMVNDLVFLARSDEEASRPPRVPLDLAGLLRDTAEPFVMMAEASGRSLEISAPDSLHMEGDAKGIERLISVLCDNAIKYSPEGDTIRLTLSEKGSFCLLQTENTPAEPIPEEKLAHLFDRFYRADDARTKRSGKSGFGIGLAIALAVCEAHSGDACAWQEDGRLRIRCRLKLHS